MEATKINETEVKKELMKSKVNAKLSHYVSGNIYYTVDLADGTYQFPISTIENDSLVSIIALVNTKIIELDKQLDVLIPDRITLEVKEKNEDPKVIQIENEISTLKSELEKMLTLSSDLGTTTFSEEMRGSELNRWIAKAIKKDEFIKIN